MKKLFFGILSLAAMVACSKDDVNEAINTFTATFDEVATRVAIDNESLELSWSADDALSVFNATAANLKYVHKGEGKFSLEGEVVSGAALSQIYAVYPYAAETEVATDGVISLELPAVQNYVAGSFGEGANTMVAVAEKDSNVLSFKNVCGYLRLNLWGSGVVKSIKLVGNDGEILAGAATVEASASAAPAVTLTGSTAAITLDCGEGVALGATAEEATPFWFVVPAQVFEKGFTFEITDAAGNTMTKSTATKREVLQNTVNTMDAINVTLVSEAWGDVIFDAQFNLDGTVTDKGKYGLTVERMVDANGNTPYMYTYAHPGYPHNNVVSFSHIIHNQKDKKHSYYKVDYSGATEFLADLNDGFTMEVITADNAWTYDWFAGPVSSDTFRLFHKGSAGNNEWNFGWTNGDGDASKGYGGAWWPWNSNQKTTKIDVTLEKFKYVHTTYVYDKDNNTINVYHNGELKGTASIGTFVAGSRLTIGGYSESDGSLYTQWNGDVAMVRMYDKAMTSEDVASRYAALTIPVAPAAPVATLNAPLLDIQWAADKSATNAGTYSSLSVDSKPNDNTSVINVEGFGHIVNFNHTMSNSAYYDGFYRVDYTNDATFKSKLTDGFTMEVVCYSNANPGDFWSRPFSTNKWGAMLYCPPGGDNHAWRAFANAGDNSWSSHGQLPSPNTGYKAFVVADNKVMTSFTHLVYVYNGETKEWGMYVDGDFNGGMPQTGFEVGSVLNINGMPYTDKVASAHGWNGKVAIARLYDETMTQEQVIARYNELQPTIEALNATIE